MLLTVDGQSKLEQMQRKFFHPDQTQRLAKQNVIPLKVLSKEVNPKYSTFPGSLHLLFGMKIITTISLTATTHADSQLLGVH